MGAVTTSSQYNAIWNALIALINAQIPAGGTLAALKDVRKSAQFSTDSVPAACVQWMGFDAKPYGSRTRLVTHHFRIAVAANSVPTSTRISNLDDAMASLTPIVDDGAGDGIVPILNNPANFGLGAVAMETCITKVQISWEIREGAGQIVWAYGFIDYDATVRSQTS